jgi:hypothetical protein
MIIRTCINGLIVHSNFFHNHGYFSICAWQNIDVGNRTSPNNLQNSKQQVNVNNINHQYIIQYTNLQVRKQ